eukprot:19571-Chlamydomonas_euryale.AAC.2
MVDRVDIVTVVACAACCNSGIAHSSTRHATCCINSVAQGTAFVVNSGALSPLTITTAALRRLRLRLLPHCAARLGWLCKCGAMQLPLHAVHVRRAGCQEDRGRGAKELLLANAATCLGANRWVGNGRQPDACTLPDPNLVGGMTRMPKFWYGQLNIHTKLAE